MSVTNVRNCILATRAFQAVLIAAIVWQFALATLFQHTPPEPRRKSESPAYEGVVAAAVELNDLEPVWNRPLQQTLIAPAPAPKAKVKPPPPPTPVKLPSLAATFVEGGTSWALMTDESGAQRIRKAGQRLDSFDIEAVTPGAVTLRKREKTYVIKVAGDQKRRQDSRRRRRSE